MALSGNETRSVFDRYNIVATDDLQEAMGRLATYHAERRPLRKAHSRHTRNAKPPESPGNSGGGVMEARGIEAREAPNRNVLGALDAGK